MWWWIACGVLVVAAVVGIAIEPRRLWPANALLAAITVAALAGLLRFVAALERLDGSAGALVFLALFFLLVAMMIALGVALLLNGVTMLRREGRSLNNSLSLLAGIGVFCYIGCGILVVFLDFVVVFSWMFLLGLPLAYLSFGFLAYLLYSSTYLWFTKRRAKAEAAVVVLGSGLIDGRVTPLLANRLDLGRMVYRNARAAGLTPLLVVSGGQGRDEPRAEADAMAEYLVEHGIPVAEVVRETASRTTWENILNTKVLLTYHKVTGRVVAVTNNFHAFRAATLMRRAGLPGQAVGAATASYFWPSATLREYVALLRDSSWINKVGLLLCCVPLLGYALFRLVG
ncbi:MAG: YdcF family protein [Propionibacteriaceae bacterium]|jgi:uncharacterized SAM-binding protein YcdF (DUF218 family)|nr:YdcF family protein [Propionibacteriaceae bacterium]